MANVTTGKTDAVDKSIEKELVKEEKVIAKGLEDFVHVGMALGRIRDAKLYRNGWGTFKEYCQDRWDMSESYVYNTISSAQTRLAIKTSSPRGGQWTEFNVRPLNRLKNKKQAARVAAEVVKEVEKNEAARKKDPTIKPIKFTAAFINKKVKEVESAGEPKVKKTPPPKIEKPWLGDYLRSKVGVLEAILSDIEDVSADAWTATEESHPGVAKRLAKACGELSAFLRS